MSSQENGHRPTFEQRLFAKVAVMRRNRISFLSHAGREDLGDKPSPVDHRDEVNLVLHANGVHGYRAEVKTVKDGGLNVDRTFIVRNRNSKC